MGHYLAFELMMSTHLSPTLALSVQVMCSSTHSGDFVRVSKDMTKSSKNRSFSGLGAPYFNALCRTDIVCLSATANKGCQAKFSAWGI